MKRSRRVVLTMMGSAAVGAVSMGFVPQSGCGPGDTLVPGRDGRPIAAPPMAALAAHRIDSTDTDTVATDTVMAAVSALSAATR
jgi:hypothetical protein